jgi:hypothetical protein
MRLDPIRHEPTFTPDAPVNANVTVHTHHYPAQATGWKSLPWIVRAAIWCFCASIVIPFVLWALVILGLVSWGVVEGYQQAEAKHQQAHQPRAK